MHYTAEHSLDSTIMLCEVEKGKHGIVSELDHIDDIDKVTLDLFQPKPEQSINPPGIVDSWPLTDFYKRYGRLQIGNFVNKGRNRQTLWGGV